MNVLMFQCIKVMSSMSYLIKRLPLQIHRGTSQSYTNEQWANSNLSLHGDDNGLVFSKQCPPLNDGVKRCFNTFKKKTCFHPTEMVSLNDVGQYMIFPARWWHRGYFNIRSNTTYYTAQLFCTADNSVWLIKKSKDNGGFQSWHRYFFLRTDIIAMIVVNVGVHENKD
jgi:hypothetical protein